MKEVTSSSLANNNMLEDQETQTIENTLHLPLPDNVKSNNDEVKMEGVTSSSLSSLFNFTLSGCVITLLYFFFLRKIVFSPVCVSENKRRKL
jgi:hypothetical protein